MRWFVLLMCLLLTGAAYPPHPDMTRVEAAFRFPGVEFGVDWKDCGFENAFYHPSTRRVTMCNELRAHPAGVQRYILAHELSHAVIMQRDIPYTGSHEWAADELAGVILTVMGHSDDLIAGAEFWLSRGADENPYDDHPGDVRRALNLACMVWTRPATYDEDGAGVCNTRWSHVLLAWVRLLELH